MVFAENNNQQGESIVTKKSKNLNATRSPSFKRNQVSEAVTAAIVTSLLATSNTVAQEADGDNKDDIIVTITATKREETVQEAALAITALDSDFMEERRMTDIKDVINYSPGVTGNSTDSFLDAISVRGVRTDDYGAGGDLSIGMFKNDLYEGRTGVAVSSFFDMDRSEVARGPQGFLFGRNAIAGAISAHTARAEIGSTEKFYNVEIGEYSRFRVDGATNVSVNDNFAMRFAALYHTEEPFLKNLNTEQPVPDTDTYAIRWSTTYEVDDTSFYTMVEYEDRSRPGTTYQTIEEGDIYDAFVDIWGDLGLPTDDPYATRNDAIYGLRDDTKMLNLQARLEQELDFAYLTVSAGYKDGDYVYSEDWDGAFRPRNSSFLNDQLTEYSQIEARLNSKGEGKFNWYAGVSFYKEDLDFRTDTAIGQEIMCNYAGGYYNYYFGTDTANTTSCTTLGAAVSAYYYNYYNFDWNDRYAEESYTALAKNDGWAAYVNFDYQFTDTVNAEFGIRTTTDNKEIALEYFSTSDLINPVTGELPFWAFYYFGITTAEPITDEDSWSDTTIRALVRWRPDDDTMYYASFTEGYKSGGFSTTAVTDPNGIDAFGFTNVTNADVNVSSFGDESVDSYELGYKDTWGESTDVNITYYFYEYTGLQVVSPDPNGGGTIIQNLGNVDANGLEFALNTQLGEYWDLYLTYSYFDSEATGIQGLCDFSGPDFDIFNPGAGENLACEGRPVYWAPKNSWAFVLNGTFPLDDGGSIYTSFDGWYESEKYGSFDYLEESKTGDTVITSLTVGYENDLGDFWAEIYVDNLTDELLYDGSYDGGGFDYMPNTSAFWWPYKPRNFGVRFGYYWD